MDPPEARSPMPGNVRGQSTVIWIPWGDESGQRAGVAVTAHDRIQERNLGIEHRAQSTLADQEQMLTSARSGVQGVTEGNERWTAFGGGGGVDAPKAG